MGAVYLVRHGQASFGAADYDRLSGPGREQAVLVGKELSRRAGTFAHARAGSLARQRDTATLALGGEAPVVADPRWNEYDHVDVLAQHAPAVGDGADPREYQAALDTALSAWVGAGEESATAESWPAFAGRVRSAFDELVSLLGKGEQAVVFTSGGVIGALCAGLVGDPGRSFLALQRVTVNAGITKLVTGRSGVSLLSFNEHAHFDGAPVALTYR